MPAGTGASGPWLFGSLRGYRPAWVRSDLVAGFTVWAVLVPEALAYATIAGVPPVTGLYAAPAALVLYAVFGSSRHLVVGPMSATAALSAGVIGGVAGASGGDFVALTTALAIVAGVVAVVAGLARLGFLAGFISEPVLKGFIVGLALTIIVGQLPKLFGIEKAEGDFFEKLWGVIRELGHVDLADLTIGVLSLVIVLLLKRFVPLLPSSLIVVALGVLAVALFGLDDHGVETVGDIAGGLPSLGLPDVPAHDYLALAPGGIGIVLVGFAEGLGAAKTYATKAGYDVDANRELLGLGAANLGAGLSSGMVVNGSLSKTAVNGGAGARSQVSGLMVAVLTILTLLFLTPLFEQLPEATLGAVVIAAVIELVDIDALRALFRVWSGRLGSIYGYAARADFLAALAAMLGVLVFDTLPGLFIGIGVSLLLLLYRASRPNIAVLGTVPGTRVWVDLERHPEARTVPGALVVRVEGGIFFANADHVRARVRELAAHHETVVLDAETVPFVDVTAARMLAELAHDLDRKHARLVVARDVGQVRDVLRRSDVEAPPFDVYPTVRAALGEETGSDDQRNT
ncbi:SulP family inorganic anion transporter [Amycolatopsis acidicola]|uniref:SulP family inorganic anion transporter n=2 Tax=Amycolatopsis acidicola TaxID=2596893 RepID=A0A5N0VDE5_9PSEU|nr:SulP family inorganic anion transporter [Amycolatopsis acidicola]